MNNKKNKTLLIVLGIFALVIVTTTASFAFFTYSRVGETNTTITSGDIEFTYKEGANASLANAFPVSDSVGAVDITGEYTFTVNLSSSSTANKMNYNVILLDDNKQTENYFNNEQIKFALIKNGTYVANTSSTEGVKLSTIDGFTQGTFRGEGVVLENQEITSGTTDTYKLRIWISDDVNYSNTELTDDNTDSENDAQESIGKYNGYKYSLKVKVTTSGMSNSISILNIRTEGKTIYADLEDTNGLSAYAITSSSSTPQDSEWIAITNDTAKSNVIRTTDSLITSKSISYTVSESGTYYLHVKNKLNQIKSKSVVVEITGELASNYIINLATTNTNELRVDTHEATGQQNFATTEYRYWGENPNNYVQFNEQLWRIIGIFDVDDGTGKIEKRLKIISNEALNFYWGMGGNINGGLGVNEWSQSDVKILLNEGDYYNRVNDYESNGLTNEAKEMIDSAKWYLGAGPESYNTLTSNDFYIHERGTTTGKICPSDFWCNDSVTRTISWIGEIGLIYPSDFGYSADMTKCSSIALSSYRDEKVCKNTSWIFDINRWTITPMAHSTDAHYVFVLAEDVYLTYSQAYVYSNWARPVAYLAADVKIIDGLGTEQQPFILSK